MAASCYDEARRLEFLKDEESGDRYRQFGVAPRDPGETIVYDEEDDDPAQEQGRP